VQVVFYDNDYLRLTQDVASGNLDVGFMMTGWFEQNYAESMGMFRFLGVKNVEFDAESYPFLTSTNIVPGFGLMARPGIPWTIRVRILSALLQLNSTHPAAVSAGISSFYPAPSYKSLRLAYQDVGLLVRQNMSGDYNCLGKWGELIAVLQCPAKHVKNKETCASRNISCPEGLYCICELCTLHQDVMMYLFEKVSNSSFR
jgi:hypothetical protein